MDGLHYFSANRAAELMRVDPRTVVAWARKSIEADDDDDVKFHGVQETATGRLLIPADEVRKLMPRRR